MGRLPFSQLHACCCDCKPFHKRALATNQLELFLCSDSVDPRTPHPEYMCSPSSVLLFIEISDSMDWRRRQNQVGLVELFNLAALDTQPASWLTDSIFLSAPTHWSSFAESKSTIEVLSQSFADKTKWRKLWILRFPAEVWTDALPSVLVLRLNLNKCPFTVNLTLWFFNFLSFMLLLPLFKMTGDFPVVQWLGLCAPNAGGQGSILGQGTRSHMLQLKTPRAIARIKDPICCSWDWCSQINKKYTCF